MVPTKMRIALLNKMFAAFRTSDFNVRAWQRFSGTLVDFLGTYWWLVLPGHTVSLQVKESKCPGPGTHPSA